MMQINEDLRKSDLRFLVDNIFEIDSYVSKMGSDKDVSTVAFSVTGQDAAKDLVRFLENGYNFILDADVSPGQVKDNEYKVFVEIERNKDISKNITEMLDGISKLCDVDNFKFRYYKSFRSEEARIENLTEVVPSNANDYEIKIKESHLNNFTNFFNRSFIESIDVKDDTITFQKMFSEPLRMKIKEFGTKKEIFDNTLGPIKLESRDMAEILYLTKFLGNYNINKIGNCFIFENNNYAVSLEKL
jgi:hypothetical protein